MLRFQIAWYKEYSGYTNTEDIECDATKPLDGLSYLIDYAEETFENDSSHTGAWCKVYNGDELYMDYYVKM